MHQLQNNGNPPGIGVEWVMPKKSAEHMQNTQPDVPKCVICHENNIDTACIPCGHYNFCFECIDICWKTRPQDGCPICKDKIMFVNKIFTI